MTGTVIFSVVLVCGIVYGSAVFVGKSASEHRRFRNRGNIGRGRSENCSVFSLYAVDFQNAGYTESLYVSRSRA